MREYVDTRFMAIAESARLVHEAETERALAYATQADLVAQAIELRFQAVDKATALAAESLSVRLEHMNEWRVDFERQRTTFITRIEIADKQSAIEGRVSALEQGSANMQGRLWAVGIAFSVTVTIINIAVGIILHFIK